jgi:hypothetical protein
MAAQARTDGETEEATFFDAHATLLRACRENGIGPTFAALEGGGPGRDVTDAPQPLLAELDALRNDP